MGATGLSVKDRGAAVATFRAINVTLMEMLAAWVPTTPEMEVKLLFGAHIWDFAQHADMLGKRTFELRLALQYSQRPADAYVTFLAELADTRATERRLAAFYGVMLPVLAARYQSFLDRTDHLVDAPTVRILDRMLADHRRMLSEAQALYGELPNLKLDDEAWLEAWMGRERSIDTPIAGPAMAVVAAG
jgi:hypothetical protein